MILLSYLASWGFGATAGVRAYETGVTRDVGLRKHFMGVVLPSIPSQSWLSAKVEPGPVFVESLHLTTTSAAANSTRDNTTSTWK